MRSLKRYSLINEFYEGCRSTLSMCLIHDVMGLETEAMPYYEQAIANGLEGESLCGAYIGLGSTYRCIGEYDKAITVLETGLQQFPDNDVMKVFCH